MSGNAEVKKIGPFPFPVVLKIGTHVVNGQVVKLNKVGFMMETNSAIVGVGDRPEVEFTLPVVKTVIQCTGIVVKILNQATGVGGSMRITEVHFKLISQDALEKIVNYLTAANSKP